MSEISRRCAILQVEIGEQQLLIETGNLAGQADGAATVRYGDTVVLVTACVGQERREREDFLPLTVDFEERLYAAGKIPGSFFRREGRPGQEATLAARLIDRPIRPLFPKGFYNEIQVVATVLSADQENNPDTLAIIGASVALGISGIPFAGPISAVRVGYVDEEFVANPTFNELARSRLDLVVAGTRDAVIMVEAGAKEVSEGIVLEAIKFGQVINGEIIEAQEAFIRAHRKPEMAFAPAAPADGLQQEAATVLQGLFPEGIAALKRAERQRRESLGREKLVEQLGDTHSAEEISAAVDAWVKSEIRASVLEKGIRVGGRRLNEIRPIKCAVGTLPRTHGSGLFSRGETQVLSITTLGSLRQTQIIDSIGPEENRRYMHHYNFAPFSTGEVKKIGTGRREIGHGALAERALLPVIPEEETFPYTIRIVSEVLSSNGSTSMASVCGSTLSLMDAGVPIKAPVAGIAMGLITGGDGRYAVLTDIEGIEDFFGDMDFKVAGTAEGITAVQMDLKTKGITYDIIEAGLKQALAGRLFILERMKETISASHTLSRYAPKMTRITIDPEKVRNVIGPGGRVIRSITEETGATIDIEDDGTVIIGAPNEESAQKAIRIIDGLTREPKVGEIYTGKVTSIMAFGAFVEILPGKDGLVHISELANYRVAQVEDVVQLGDEITVIVLGIDPQGRIKLSRRALLTPQTPQTEQTPQTQPRGPRRDMDSGPRYREAEARQDRRPLGPRDARPRQPFTRRPDPRE